MAWQRFTVNVNGEPPREVQTNARDWAGVAIDPNNPRAMDMTFRVVHAALLRSGVTVPRDYLAFLDVLDDMPEALDDGDATALDPTDGTPLEGSP